MFAAVTAGAQSFRPAVRATQYAHPAMAPERRRQAVAAIREKYDLQTATAAGSYDRLCQGELTGKSHEAHSVGPRLHPLDVEEAVVLYGGRAMSVLRSQFYEDSSLLGHSLHGISQRVTA